MGYIGFLLHKIKLLNFGKLVNIADIGVKKILLMDRVSRLFFMLESLKAFHCIRLKIDKYCCFSFDLFVGHTIYGDIF
jgi:hypothetical protein